MKNIISRLKYYGLYKAPKLNNCTCIFIIIYCNNYLKRILKKHKKCAYAHRYIVNISFRDLLQYREL